MIPKKALLAAIA